MNSKRLTFSLLILWTTTAAAQDHGALEASVTFHQKEEGSYLEAQAPLRNGLVKTRIPVSEIEDRIEESLQDVVRVRLYHLVNEGEARRFFYYPASVSFGGSIRVALALTLEVERREVSHEYEEWSCDFVWSSTGMSLRDCIHSQSGRTVYFNRYGKTALYLGDLTMGGIIFENENDKPYIIH